jgi:hypothetical protein
MAAVSFYVRKAIGEGAIRFGVAPSEPPPAGTPGAWSTGPGGEFRRRGSSHLFFADSRDAGMGGFPVREKKRGRFDTLSLAIMGIMLFGAMVVFLGIGVVMLKGAHGWVQIVAGVAIMVAPFVVTAKKRREERARREAETREREIREADLRERIGTFAARLAELPERHDEAALEEMRRDRASRDIPYDVVAPAGREAVLRVGFAELELSGDSPERIARIVEASAAAVGLEPDDIMDVKTIFFKTVVWHLIADGRVDRSEIGPVQQLQAALSLGPDRVGRETAALEELTALAEAAASMPKRTDCVIDLRPREACHHLTPGRILEPETKKKWLGLVTRPVAGEWSSGEASTICVTSRRVALVGAGLLELSYDRITDIDIDYDRGRVTILAGDDEPVHVNVPDPIYTAGIIELARETALRGRYFAAAAG